MKGYFSDVWNLLAWAVFLGMFLGGAAGVAQGDWGGWVVMVFVPCLAFAHYRLFAR